MTPRPRRSTLFPYTTLFRSGLIVAVPLLLLLLVIWALRKYRQRRKVGQPSRLSQPPPPIPPTSGPASVTALLVFLALGASALPALADDAAPSAISNTVSIISATYTGTVQDKVAQFDATIQIATTATNQIVPLFGEDVALESFTAKGDAKLVREGRTVGVLLPARGAVTLQLKLIARLGGDVTRRQLVRSEERRVGK